MVLWNEKSQYMRLFSSFGHLASLKVAKFCSYSGDTKFYLICIIQKRKFSKNLIFTTLIWTCNHYDSPVTDNYFALCAFFRQGSICSFSPSCGQINEPFGRQRRLETWLTYLSKEPQRKRKSFIDNWHENAV